MNITAFLLYSLASKASGGNSRLACKLTVANIVNLQLFAFAHYKADRFWCKILILN